MNALKSSDLPQISDAVMVARGPVSSLLAQYYLESVSLKGLIMIDPILFRETLGGCEDEKELSERVSSDLYPDDPDSSDRFRSQRLLVEPNSVPMMVVRTVSLSEEDNHNDADNKFPLQALSSAWRSCSKHVAERHGDPAGPYGEVPLVDLPINWRSGGSGDEAFATVLLDCIESWIDEDVQWK